MALADLLGLDSSGALLPQARPNGVPVVVPAQPQATPVASASQVHQPSKFRNFLGALGDALLVAHGQQPLYREMQAQRQQTQALQGFLTNPDQAIAQLMQIPGQAANAIDLYKAVHPASETPLEIKLLQHLKEHPEDAAMLHQIDAELHPGMMTPVTIDSGATIQQPGTPPQAAIDYLKANPSLAPQFDQKYGAGASSKILGGQTATPSGGFR